MCWEQYHKNFILLNIITNQKHVIEYGIIESDL